MMAEINMTPFVDVMLVLLVIFIVTAPFITPQILKVNLPKTDTVAQSKNPKVARLIIDASGIIAFEGKIVNETDLAKSIQSRFKKKIYIFKCSVINLCLMGELHKLWA